MKRNKLYFRMLFYITQALVYIDAHKNHFPLTHLLQFFTLIFYTNHMEDNFLLYLHLIMNKSYDTSEFTAP